MLRNPILLLLGFLALTSATITPEKNFFFLPSNNGLSSLLFQTRNGTIAYSVDLMQDGQYAAHYVQINTETNNITPILQDLTTACGQGPSAFSRLQYHVLTYSFVYYCTNNNSIMVLNGRNYEVETVVSLNINETFDEVRITTEGYSVAILGLSGLFSRNPGPSHLIKYSLQTQAVVNHIVFDHDFAEGEVVTAYNTNGNFFIITNIFTTTNYGNVYAMTLIGNSYSLTHLTAFNSSSAYPSTVPEFYVIKDLIFTNNEDNLVILDTNGNVQRVLGGVALNEIAGSVYRPAIISFPGIGSVYVSLQNNSLLEISVVSQGFSIDTIGTARSISIAIQDQLTDNLLYSFNGEGTTGNFEITNLDSGKVVYESVSGFTNFMITDKTYAALNRLYLLYIFDRETNELLKTIAVNDNSYYDQKSSTFSFLTLNDVNYTFQQVDLRTGNIYTLSSPSWVSWTDPWNLVHATNDETFDSPELIIGMPHFSNNTEPFLIVSKTFGQVKFVPAPIDLSYEVTLAVDYDTLTTFYIVGSNGASTSITEYNYVSSNNSFVSTRTNQNLLSGSIIPGIDYSVVTTRDTIGVIDMSSFRETDYSFSMQLPSYPFTFQNTSNGFNMLLSQPQTWGGSQSQPAVILYNDQVEELPGTTDTTVQAGVGGSCSYWVVNQVGAFGMVTFYNICNNDNIFEIIA